MTTEPRRSPWLKRIAILVAVVGMFLWLYLPGRGKTTTLGAFTRRVNVRLQRLQPGPLYSNWRQGLIVAQGEGVFEIMSLAEVWDAYQRDAMTLDEAAEEMAERIVVARAFDEALGERSRILALPLARRAVSPFLTEEQAAQQYVVRRGETGLPLYLCAVADLGTTPGLVRPLLRDQVARVGGTAGAESLLESTLDEAADVPIELVAAGENAPTPWRLLGTPTLPALALLCREDFETEAARLLTELDATADVIVFEVICRGLNEVYLRPGRSTDQSDWYLRFGNPGSENRYVAYNADGVEPGWLDTPLAPAP